MSKYNFISFCQILPQLRFPSFRLLSIVHSFIFEHVTFFISLWCKRMDSCINSECVSSLDRTETTWVHLRLLDCLHFIVLWKSTPSSASLWCCPRGDVTFASCLATLTSHTQLLTWCIVLEGHQPSYESTIESHSLADGISRKGRKGMIWGEEGCWQNHHKESLWLPVD